MSEIFLTNIPVSIRQRLLNKARTENRTFNELLQYYAMERFLYRLSISAHAEKFILKGALMLRVWHSPETRPTMDIDMLGRTSNRESDIIAQFEDILLVNVESDGLVFDSDTIRTEHITEDADYEGVRVRFQGTLDTARINMQIDIGFGDVVLPEPEIAEVPTILDSPVPRLLCYSRESAIAEKFEAMVKRRELNSRMKDFYDIWLLSRQFDFEGILLSEAIKRTFQQRGTNLSDDIVAFAESFATEKQAQWMAFRKRLRSNIIPPDFNEVVSTVKKFLAPVADSIRSGELLNDRWVASDRWHKS